MEEMYTEQMLNRYIEMSFANSMVLRQVCLTVLIVEQRYTVVGAISIAGEGVCSRFR